MTQTVAEAQLFATCLQGNRDAVLFVQKLFDAAHFWDDLIDRDKKLDDATIHANLYALAVEIPSNPFYQRHQASLMPLIVMAVHNWRHATDLERAGDSLEVAFVLRSSYADILVMCAHLIGGPDHARECAAKVRAFCHSEGFQGFKDALLIETTVREPRCEFSAFNRREAA